jgi:cation diffusion facilitator family transporter
MSESTSHLRKLRYRAAWTSMSIGVLLLGIKMFAYFLTHSTAVLSDALESIINVVASAFAWYSVWLSSQPADDTHPYGHGRVEFFSSGFEGALIILASIAIIVTAVPAFIHPKSLAKLDVGLAMLLVGGVVNYGLGVYLIRTGKRVRSDALVADGHHVHSDAYTSFGVILGLFLVRLTGWRWLDPLAACLVGLNIFFSGWKLTAGAVAKLMNQAEEPYNEQVAKVLTTVRKPGWVAPHYLRSWQSGAQRFVDFHLILPRFWTLEQVHEVHQVIEPAVLSATNEDGQVIIHFDPCTKDNCTQCDLSDCPIRSQPSRKLPIWTASSITERSVSHLVES